MAGPLQSAYPKLDWQVESPRFLAVEGIDDQRVFESLARHIGVADLQVKPYGGKNNISSFLRILTTLPSFAQLKSLAIVADADDEWTASADRIRSALRQVGLPAPGDPLAVASQGGCSVVFLIVPHGRRSGMLEDVCLESVEMDPAVACVDSYFACLARTSIKGPKMAVASKARMHVFLASRESPGLRLGEAAQRGIWPFNSHAFAPMKQLLGML